MWIEALRSGEFRQSLGGMREADGTFCCFGVAAELAGIPSVECEILFNQIEYQWPAGLWNEEDDEETYLRLPVRWFANRFGASGQRAKSMLGASLADESFEMIADFLEREFKKCDSVTAAEFSEDVVVALTEALNENINWPFEDEHARDVLDSLLKSGFLLIRRIE